VGTKRAIGTRSAIVAGAIAAIVCASVALASEPSGFHLVNTHKLSSVRSLGKVPKPCPVTTGLPCIQVGSYGSVTFTPHILKPGGILTGKVTPTKYCHDCLATWPTTGSTVVGNVLQFLHRLKGCGALSCRWRLAKDAPAEAYMVIAMDISPRPPANGPSNVSSYVGVRSSWEWKYFQ
jgi:hypothetical protein